MESQCPLILFFFFFFVFSRAASAACGGSQARGLNQSCCYQPAPEPQPRRIWAASLTYTTAHGNARSLTRWVRPGIKPATSLFLVGFVNHWATTETPTNVLSKHNYPWLLKNIKIIVIKYNDYMLLEENCKWIYSDF